MIATSAWLYGFFFHSVKFLLACCTSCTFFFFFEFQSEAGAQLIGSLLLFKWRGHGWCVGEIIRQNTDARVKVGGKSANFICKYDRCGW